MLEKEKKSIKKFSVLFLMAVITLGLALLAAFKLEGEQPGVSITFSTGEAALIGKKSEIALTVMDRKSGIRSIEAALIKDGREVPVLQKEFSKSGFFLVESTKYKEFRITVEPRKLGFTDGYAVLKISVQDYSWRRFGCGSLTMLEKEVMIDTKAPAFRLLSKRQNARQGGSGLAVYKLLEKCKKSGVSIGGKFFPGYAAKFGDKEVFFAFFALGYKQSIDTDIYAHAEDFAGNVFFEKMPKYFGKKKFKHDILNISKNFLERKIPEFQEELPDNTYRDSLVSRFLFINENVRKSDYTKIKEICKNPEQKILWEKSFLRLPGSATKALFGDHREYRYKGKVIDRQVHMGVDLASVAQSSVPATNSGKVVFADRLGIYGKAVIIDHGLGLFSMYAHLSSIEAVPGEFIERGETLGATGETGLAGGDHLHFSIILNEMFVNPEEWFDPAWVKNNITSKIKAAAMMSN